MRKKKRMSKSIRTVLIAMAFTVCGMTTVFAEELAAEPLSTEQGAENVTAKDETKKQDMTTEPPTTPTPTTQQPTTPTPTTQEPTTQPLVIQPPTTQPPANTSTKVTAWGKNSKGQFVNGNKQVIPGATMKGIDVSKWNGKIDWNKVAKSDVDYAIIRCGYGSDIKSQDDPYWATNVAGCEKYNIPYGVYIYSYATTTSQAKSEANHVLRLIKGHTLNFPIYYDMEDSSQAKLSKSKREKIANAFLKVISDAGYECSIYANLNWWNNYLPGSLAQQTAWKWVAQYNNNACTYTGSYLMWQCTSTGKVSGISGNVDINFWFGPVRTRLYNIQKVTQTQTIAAPKPVTAPKKVTMKSAKAGKKKASIKWKKVSGAKGYQIQYSTSKKFTKKTTKSKTTKKTSITIKKLKAKKTYYFRVKAYKTNAANTKIYSKKWSKVKKAKIKK